MELDKKRFSIRRHITLVLTLLTVLIVLLIGVCVAVVREQSRIRLTSAADSYLSLLTRTLENQLVIQESYITSQVLNSEELHRLGFGEGHIQAYLDSYKLHTGFSSAMAAGNDVTALYLYSEPNSILMSEYATAQVGRPTETQIQKTNLEETLRSMVDANTLDIVCGVRPAILGAGCALLWCMADFGGQPGPAVQPSNGRYAGVCPAGRRAAGRYPARRGRAVSLHQPDS